MARAKFRPSHGGSKELQPLLRRLQEQGWRLSKTRKGHIKATSPEGRFVFLGYSADWRAMKNSIAELRRAGITGI
jgi:hypothetical protein